MHSFLNYDRAISAAIICASYIADLNYPGKTKKKTDFHCVFLELGELQTECDEKKLGNFWLDFCTENYYVNFRINQIIMSVLKVLVSGSQNTPVCIVSA